MLITLQQLITVNKSFRPLIGFLSAFNTFIIDYIVYPYNLVVFLLVGMFFSYILVELVSLFMTVFEVSFFFNLLFNYFQKLGK